MQQRTLLRLTALLGAASVGLGAFAAHGLEAMVTADRLEIFQTGVRYQFYHTLAIGFVAALIPSPLVSTRRASLAVYLWLVGIAVFCGSLYLFTLREYHSIPTGLLGPITPLGGLFFIAGWVVLFFAPARNGADTTFDA